jgi:hypothetical protein
MREILPNDDVILDFQLGSRDVIAGQLSADYAAGAN